MAGADEARGAKLGGHLWDRTLAAIMMVDPATHTIVDINDRALQMIGRTRGEVVGSVCHAHVCPTEAGRCPITDLGRSIDSSERLLKSADGRQVPILKSVSEIVVDGRPLLLESFVDIAPLKETERALEESRRFIKSVVDGLGDPVLVIDPADHRIILANRAHVARQGKDPVALGLRCHEASHDSAHPCDEGHGECPLRSVVATGKPARATHRHVTAAGGESFVDILATPVFDAEGRVARVVESCRDITHIRQGEEERAQLNRLLLQAQKMESIGRLASGIAHDFNNILLATIGFADAAAEKLPAGHAALPDLESVVTAGERGTGLVRQLLAFGRQQDLQMRRVDLNALVEETRRLLTHVLPRRVAIDLWLGDAIPPVLADPVQLQQVLMNLAVNARDAMPGGGTLTVATEPAGLADPAMTAPLGLPPGLYALLRVHDTGCGMTPEVRERAFEPFFTTKEEGRGTGLGLSTAYGIVGQHGGTIRVDSEPERGSVFTIWLPAFEEAAAGAGGPGPLPRGGETVLVVEDEAPTRRVVARILENLGYRVLEAGSGAECLVLLEERAAQVQLVLCDMMLPGMNGRDLAAMLRERLPSLEVLFMSGHSREHLARQGLLDGSDRLIAKAEGTAAIARAVRAALDAGPGR